LKKWKNNGFLELIYSFFYKLIRDRDCNVLSLLSMESGTKSKRRGEKTVQIEGKMIL